MGYFKFIVFMLPVLVSASGSDDSLLSIVQVFRHGERTPITFYPTDPYKNSSYWNGLGTGELTNNGKVQLYELGQYFRERYGDFLSTNYLEDEVNIISATTNRNRLSAESFLSGLYLNKTTEIIIQNASSAVMGSLAECLKYDIYYAEMELSDEYFKRINEENSEVYEYLRENSQFPVLELASSSVIWDTLHIEERFNFTLPNWTESIFPEVLTNLSSLYGLSLCYDERLQELGAGPFLNQITEHFEAIIADPSSTQKVQLYSGHDVNIACILNAFQAFTPHMPDFASSLILELRQTNKTFINAFYKPNEEVIPITLKGCNFDCEIEEFKNIFKNITINEQQWKEKCSLI